MLVDIHRERERGDRTASMFIARRIKMDPKVIGQQWAKFLKQQVSALSSQTSTEEDLAKNPYYSKYADKLKQAQLSQTATESQKIDLNEEERKIKEKLVELERKLEKKNPASNEDQCRPHGRPTKNKKLDDVIRLDRIKGLDKEQIRGLWFEFFKSKDATIFACLDAAQYNEIRERARKYPVFVFLLPTNQVSDGTEANKNNYQFVLVQFDSSQPQSLKVYFTPLAFFHTHKENAPAALSLNYFGEMQQEKDIVLMEGEYDDKIFNLLEAQCLANQIQLFYATPDANELLANFNNDPATFDYMRVVEKFEKSIQTI